MILCALSTSRSSEQSTKHRSLSENMWKVCLFNSHNNKIARLSNMEDTFVEKFTWCTKVCGLFFLTAIFRCWLAEQANCDDMERRWCFFFSFCEVVWNVNCAITKVWWTEMFPVVLIMTASSYSQFEKGWLHQAFSLKSGMKKGLWGIDYIPPPLPPQNLVKHSSPPPKKRTSNRTTSGKQLIFSVVVVVVLITINKNLSKHLFT